MNGIETVAAGELPAHVERFFFSVVSEGSGSNFDLHAVIVEDALCLMCVYPTDDMWRLRLKSPFDLSGVLAHLESVLGGGACNKVGDYYHLTHWVSPQSISDLRRNKERA